MKTERVELVAADFDEELLAVLLQREIDLGARPNDLHALDERERCIGIGRNVEGARVSFKSCGFTNVAPRDSSPTPRTRLAPRNEAIAGDVGAS